MWILLEIHAQKKYILITRWVQAKDTSRDKNIQWNLCKRRFSRAIAIRVWGRRCSKQTVLLKLVSTGEAVPGSQDTLLRCVPISLLHCNRRRWDRQPSGWILLEGTVHGQRLQPCLYHGNATLPMTRLRQVSNSTKLQPIPKCRQDLHAWASTIRHGQGRL